MKNPWMRKIEANRMSSLDIMLETQKFWNDRNSCKNPKNWDSNSLNMVKAIHECVGFELISVQPMWGPGDVVKFNKLEYDEKKYKEWVRNSRAGSSYKVVPQEEPVLAKSKLLKTRYRGRDVRYTLEEIASETSMEIIADLRNNAAQTYTYKWRREDTTKYGATYLLSQIYMLNSHIFRKTLTKPKSKWIVTSPDIASMLFEFCNYGENSKWNICSTSIGPYKAGTIVSMSGYDVYVDPLFPKGQVLVGQTTDVDCYSYNPYVSVCYLEDGKMMSRYSKRLSKEGRKNYALLTVEGF